MIDLHSGDGLIPDVHAEQDKLEYHNQPSQHTPMRANSSQSSYVQYPSAESSNYQTLGLPSEPVYSTYSGGYQYERGPTSFQPSSSTMTLLDHQMRNVSLYHYNQDLDLELDLKSYK